LAVLVIFVLLSAGLSAGLVAELSELLQLHVLKSSLPQFVQTGGWQHAQIICERPRAQGCQHMIHGNFRAEVPDTHCHFAKPINKGSQDSPFSWRMPTRAMEVRWCGLLVAN